MPIFAVLADDQHPISSPEAAALHCYQLHVIIEWLRTLRLVVRIGGHKSVDLEDANELDTKGYLACIEEFEASYQQQLERAFLQHRPASTPAGSIAERIEMCAAPWSPRTHASFPMPERKRALWLMLMSKHILDGHLDDVWLSEVIPRVLTRLPERYEVQPFWTHRFLDLNGECRGGVTFEALVESDGDIRTYLGPANRESLGADG